MDAEYYNQFYKERGADVHCDPARFAKIAELCRGRVLDLGCGTGDLADFYKGEYQGWDFSKVAIEIARSKRRPNATWKFRDITFDLAYMENRYDTAVLAEVLEHMDNDSAIFERLVNVMNPNGRWVISVPNGLAVPDKSHVRTFTIPELRKKFEPYGRVKFHRWSGEKQRIIMTVDLEQKPKKDLALVMILKNEEKGLEYAILSAIEIADKIVLSVDTKSTDRTLEIAKLYADVLKRHEWHDDFAAARNEAQADIEEKWILCIDGHEYVKQTGALEEALKADVDGLFVKVIMDGGLEYFYPRIYRNYIKWTGAVHNLNPCVTKKNLHDFVVVHDRQNLQAQNAVKERIAQRHKMVPEIMGARLKKNKKDVRASFYMANFFMGSRDFKKSRKFYKLYLKFSKFTGERWLACHNVATMYLLERKLLRALWWTDKAEKEERNRWEIAKLKGLIYLTAGWYQKAAENLVNAFCPENPNHYYKPFRRNEAEIWEMLASCFTGLKKYNEAKKALTFALEKEIAQKYRLHLEKKLAAIEKIIELEAEN